LLGLALDTQIVIKYAGNTSGIFIAIVSVQIIKNHIIFFSMARKMASSTSPNIKTSLWPAAIRSNDTKELPMTIQLSKERSVL